MADRADISNSSSTLEIISHLSHLIARTTDIHDLLDSSLVVIRSAVAAKDVSILLLNSDRTELNMWVSSVIPHEEWSTVHIPVGQGIAGRVAQTGKSVFVARIGKASPEPSQAPARHRYRTDSYISVPLPSSGKGTILGVLNITDHVDGREMTSVDLQMVQAIAALIASALESHFAWAQAHEARQRLSDMLAGLPIGMFTISEPGNLTLCNLAAQRYLEAQGVDVLGKPWRNYFPEGVGRHIHHALHDLHSGQPAYSVEFEMPAENGDDQAHAVRMSAVETEELGCIGEKHLLFLVEDLQQRQELAELRHSGQMKSNFLSLISHELRTPLAAIKGGVHLLNQLAPPEMRESAKSIFAILHRNSDRLTRLVNNVLDVMDLEAGTLTLYRKRVDLHALTTRVAQQFEGAVQDKQVKWVLSLDAPKYEIYVDEGRIAQVIEHLVENAVKFVSDNGTITVSSCASGGLWRLSVANSGREIDPEQRQRIFSKFYQIDTSLTRETGGSGLGLYLCREIMRLHGGDVQVDTDFTGGTSITVSIPEITELV